MYFMTRHRAPVCCGTELSDVASKLTKKSANTLEVGNQTKVPSTEHRPRHPGRHCRPRKGCTHTRWGAVQHLPAGLAPALRLGAKAGRKWRQRSASSTRSGLTCPRSTTRSRSSTTATPSSLLAGTSAACAAPQNNPKEEEKKYIGVFAHFFFFSKLPKCCMKAIAD